MAKKKASVRKAGRGAATSKDRSQSRQTRQTAEPEPNASQAVLQAQIEQLNGVIHQLELKVHELETAQETQLYAEGIVETLREPLVVLDSRLRACFANAAFYQAFHVAPEEIEQRPLYELGGNQWDIPELWSMLQNILQSDVQVSDCRVEHTFDGISQRRMLLNAHKIWRTDGRPDEILLSFNDITDQHRVEQELRDRELRLQAVFDHTLEFLGLLAPDGTVLRANRTVLNTRDAAEADLIGQPVWLTPFWTHSPELQARLQRSVQRAAAGEIDRFEATHTARDGSALTVDFALSPVRDESGRVALLVAEGRDITERRTAEDALRTLNTELEQRIAERTQELRLLSETVTHLGEGVLITDDDLDWPGPTILFVNEAMCRISGYAAEELIGQSPRILHGERTSAETRAHIRRELTTGRSCLVEVINYRKNGTAYDAELFITPLTESSGHRTNYVSIHRDISDRKRAEKRLQKSEERFRNIFENAATGMAITDMQGRFVHCNAAYCAIVGYSAEELHQLPFSSLVHPDDVAQNLQLVQELKNGERDSYEVENRYVPKKGPPVWVSEFVSLLYEERDTPTYFIALATDITARKKAEQLVRDREERMRAILDTASDAIITIDKRGTMQDVNPATGSMFGYTEDELVGQNVHMLMPEPYCHEHDGYIAHYLETGMARIIGSGRELVARRKDGSTFPVGLVVSEVNYLGLFTGIIRDISDRVELQRQILAIAAEEDRRIGHELHDSIQQQLTGLGLLARSLADALADKSAPESDLAARLASGINDSAGQVHLLSRGLIPVEVDAQGLRASLADLASAINEQHMVQCVFHCDQVVELADNFVATHLFRIAQESVNNTIKHGQANRIDISLTRDGNSITLKVLDNGIGIAKTRKNDSGMGLRIMGYRAGLIGSTLQIERGAAGGTQVTCVVSIKGVAADD